MGAEMVRPEAAELDLGRVAESIVVRGDLSALTPAERARFYVQMCESLGLNPASQPLDFLRLNGKEVLYANRRASDQLARLYRVTREIIRGPEVIDLAGAKLILAVCKATLPDGRSETATATCKLQDACGLENVLMKSETKAKRRATLSILGLGLLDESEVETIPDAERIDPRQVPTLPAPPAPPEEDRPEDSSRAVAAFEEWLGKATALDAVPVLWRDALLDLRAEGKAPEEWTPALGEILDAWLRDRGYVTLSAADRTALMGGVMMADFARWHDTLSHLSPEGDTVLRAAEVWLDARWSSLDAEASKPYRLALSRWLAAALGTPEDTRGAGVKLGAAVKALRDQRAAAVDAASAPPAPPTRTREPGDDDDEPPPAAPPAGTLEAKLDAALGTPRKGRSRAAAATQATEDTSWQLTREGMERHASDTLGDAFAVKGSATKHRSLVGYASVLAERLQALDMGDEHGTRETYESALRRVNGWMAQAQSAARRAA